MVIAVMAGSAAEPNKSAQIGGTGNIAPATGVLLLRGIPGSSIRDIFVQAGGRVKKGDPLVAFDDAVTKGEADLAALDLASATRLAEVKVGVQGLAVRLTEQKLDRARQEAATYRAVGPAGTSERELSRLAGAVEEARLALELEKAKDEQLRSETATAVKAASTRVELANAKAARLVVRAPSDGMVLRLDRWVGEQVAGEPVVEFADLSTMQVNCQIYEGDLLKLRKGMKATIKNAALAEPLTGSITQIGQFIDARSQLGEVKIRLDRAEPADRLIGMAVDVSIAP
jgi:multidrug resistance efflux pump